MTLDSQIYRRSPGVTQVWWLISYFCSMLVMVLLKHDLIYLIDFEDLEFKVHFSHY